MAAGLVFAVHSPPLPCYVRLPSHAWGNCLHAAAVLVWQASKDTFFFWAEHFKAPWGTVCCFPKLICKSKQHESATGHCSTPASPFTVTSSLYFMLGASFFPRSSPLNWSSLIQFSFLFFLWVILVLCSVFNKCLKWMKEVINYLGLYKGI